MKRKEARKVNKFMIHNNVCHFVVFFFFPFTGAALAFNFFGALTYTFSSLTDSMSCSISVNYYRFNLPAPVSSTSSKALSNTENLWPRLFLD